MTADTSREASPPRNRVDRWIAWALKHQDTISDWDLLLLVALLSAGEGPAND